MKLYEYVILRREKARKDKDGNDVAEKLTVIQDVKRLVAKDDRVATMTAAREIPPELVDRLDEVEIGLRPF